MNILNIKHSLSLLMFFLLLFSGCATKVDRLEYALEFAGENRRGMPAEGQPQDTGRVPEQRHASILCPRREGPVQAERD